MTQQPHAEPATAQAPAQVTAQVTGQAEQSGDARVDEALARLDELDQRPVEQHVELFDDVHRRLRAALEDAAAEHAPARQAGDGSAPPASPAARSASG